MRAYLDTLRDRGQLHIVRREVDPVFELAAVVEASQAVSDAPILFEHVRGSRFPVAANLYGSVGRLHEIIGAPPGGFNARWAEIMAQAMRLGTSATRATAPANDLMEATHADLPRIKWREKDRGAYISAGIFYARDPETGVGNLSFCRTFMAEDEVFVCDLVPFHDLASYHAKAEAQGKPLDVAILLGTSPEIFLAACASIPREMDEMAVAAAIRGEPIAMRPCRSIDLSVPAETEIVIEGRLRPGERRPEGPFGEYMGYYGPVNTNGYVFDVAHVSYRPGAIFQGLLCGTAEDLVPLNYMFAARSYLALAKDFPGLVLDVASNPMFFSAIVRIRKTDDKQPAAIIERAFTGLPKYMSLCIVVDEDIDIHDMQQVMHAYVTRGRVDRRLTVHASTDDGRRVGGRVGIDATTPMNERGRTERSQIPGARHLRLEDYLAG